MKKSIRKNGKENAMRSPNFLAVLALVTEMAKRLNENIANIELKPLGEPLLRVPKL